ncbi:MAG: DUF1802 family protein [Verrucomicrobiota bacterium]
MSTFPAFKEWRSIVEAMGHGAQSIILRKGGISEEGGSFHAKYPRFWLLPTEFHQQLERSKPEAKKYFDFGSTLVQEVEVKYWAESIHASYLSTWDEVHALDSFHLLKEEILKERFDYGEAPGLHLLIVRVYQVKTPVRLPWLKSYDGCKSWIDLDSIPDFERSTPVLNEFDFSNLLKKMNYNYPSHLS